MNNSFNNKIKYFLILIISIGMSIGGYYAYKYFQKPSKTEIQKQTEEPVKEEYNIFPKLEPNYFEEFLSTKDGEKILNEDIVYELINDLAKRINIPEGDINFHWNIISEYEIDIHIKIISKDKEYTKSYKFKLDYD
ncbi:MULTISPECIES: MHO_1590 family protein [unclassified Mycoplasma]|uniref:MHO_1590 family protein n=1 Tax=unclassified Mycoplasma TaxID=2683645 RepID=UPI00211BDEE9|nr:MULTISPECIES: hypothetical protein [unclassified Mycoplasma]UUM19654.1 hypothetical protein NPA11_02690 [Mycoplasma sp. 1578d]UUM24623.1 hypothetical protein NPA12_02915 [Mycoplasma sp. 3686d]